MRVITSVVLNIFYNDNEHEIMLNIFGLLIGYFIVFVFVHLIINEH